MNNNEKQIRDFENAYISLETYLKRITGLPDHVGVMGFFEKILPHKYYVKMQTLRKYRNVTNGHGYRLGGKLPVPPIEYAQFLRMELNWAQQNEHIVKKKILDIYNRPRKTFANKKGTNFVTKQNTASNSTNTSANGNSRARKKPCPPFAIIVAIQCVMLGIYSLIVGISNAVIENFAFKSIIIGGGTIFLLSIGAFFVKWVSISMYKTGSFVLIVGILLNTILLITLGTNYMFNFPITFLFLAFFGIIIAKTSFRRYKTSFGVFNIIEIALSLVGFVFGFILLINNGMIEWTFLQWCISLFLCSIVALLGFIIWLLDEEISSFSETVFGSIMLATVIVANFIFSCIYKLDYQCIFYCLTVASISYGIVLAKHTIDGSFKSERKSAFLPILEIVVAIVMGVIFFFAT